MKITIEDKGKKFVGYPDAMLNCKQCCLFNKGNYQCENEMGEICNIFSGFAWKEVTQEPILPIPTIKKLSATIGTIKPLEFAGDANNA